MKHLSPLFENSLSSNDQELERILKSTPAGRDLLKITKHRIKGEAIEFQIYTKKTSFHYAIMLDSDYKGFMIKKIHYRASSYSDVIIASDDVLVNGIQLEEAFSLTWKRLSMTATGNYFPLIGILIPGYKIQCVQHGVRNGV